ncbi:hypothetical protein SELMODRAFT_408312 [Selaginella moellendorffii]|uniref:Condensin-2 complex subunit H2 n=1 Tax=Selaginella moellendorffii TaxID=88036 RepID=D8R7W5_SELML|nr:condensin-2 complex subunit H2 [Selaginella moellendorffii]EFJ31951.1 hypothetical protein SELMODRAFT_408312 [Selaginella moellendorffii]|eukprot:XP_002967352.1 condensin-2 complex subunit H2 [Selaginella moellendorffii]
MASGEGEPRYAHLLQPCRDLGENWSVDVAQELEEYLSQLHLTPLFQDGQSCLNFAEAALLIQGSTQVYSKKVEYLYALVLQALSFITQKKCALPENGSAKEAEVVEEEKEEEFLNLDDVPEETNIDLNDGESIGITPSLNRPPTSLLVVEGDAFETMKNGGELSTYQIATSFLYRDFLLLDPCDAEAVDNYLYVPRAERATPRPPSSSRSRSHRASTPGRRASSGKKTRPSYGGDDFCEGPEDDFEPCSARNINFDAPLEGANNIPHADEQQQQDDEDDPWARLNPHEPGTLLVKPYKRGLLSRKKPTKSPVVDVEFPMATRNGTTFCEFLEALQDKEAADRLKRTTKTNSRTAEKAKTDFQTAAEPPESDDEPDNVDNFEPWDDTVPEAGGETEPLNAPEGETSFEKLCHATRDSVMQTLVEAELRAELASRVSNWKVKVEASLAKQDARPAFDIHVYGERIIERCLHEAPEQSDGVSSFTQIVKGQDSHDVARSFAALLQLVNNGNVLIERDAPSGTTGCFTAETPFKVKLLSSQKVHEDMLHYQAPSHAARTKEANTPPRVKRQATRLDVLSPPIQSQPGEAFTGVENATPKLTPVSKRRCKRRPLQAIKNANR